MNPYQLIGMGYRLGSDPVKHGTADCLSLARTVLDFYGIPSTEPCRDWYRRLRKKDYSVFEEELERWGQKTDEPTIGTVALCQSDDGYGMAVYFEGGCLSFVGSAVRWSPIENLQVVAFYCNTKPTSATQSG